MAQANKNALVEQLAKSHLPAKKAPAPATTREPTEKAPATTTPATHGRRTYPGSPTPKPIVATEPAEKKGAAVAPEKPITDFYTVNGQEYTLEELKEKGLLPKLVTTYEQHQHLQKKHLEKLEELESLKKTPPATTTKQPTQAEVWAIVKREYAALVSQAIARDTESGEVEADMVEMYPEFAKTAYTRILWQQGMIDDLRQAVWELQNSTKNVLAKEAKSSIEKQIIPEIDKLAASDEVYSLLNDEATRAGFMEFLFDLDPRPDQVIGEKAQAFLAKQWFAFNADAIKEGTQIETAADKKRSRPTVGGEGPSSRPGAYKETEPSHIDELASSRLPLPQ